MRDALNDLVKHFRINWHEVPYGTTVPAGMLVATVRKESVTVSVIDRPVHHNYGLCYTPERLTPELPTEPGALVKAHTDDVPERRVFMRTKSGWIDGCNRWQESGLIDPVLLATIPRGSGVMDETNKSPVIDSSGARWEWNPLTDMWICPKWSEVLGSKAAIASECGLLRPADAEGGDQ